MIHLKTQHFSSEKLIYIGMTKHLLHIYSLILYHSNILKVCFPLIHAAIFYQKLNKNPFFCLNLNLSRYIGARTLLYNTKQPP